MMIIDPKITPHIASPYGNPKHSSSGFFGGLDAGGGASACSCAPQLEQNVAFSEFSDPQL
jgi:hypothetical protein